MINQFNPVFRRTAWVGLAISLAFALPVARAEDQPKQDFHPSEKVGEALTKLKPLQDAKNYAGMIALVDSVLPTVPPTSYDAAYLLDIKARLMVTSEQYAKAVEPWEQALKLSDQFGYFDTKMTQEISKFLAQLIFFDASTIKDKTVQQQQYRKAGAYIKRYLDHSTKPEVDSEVTYAQILYSLATADDKNVNMNELNEARGVIERALQGSVRPKDTLYMILMAVLQNENDYVHSAEIMELVLKQYPNKKDIWPMLFGTYVNLAGTAKQDSPEQREYYVRAINAMERAQALGFMNTPRDNFNLVTLYLNAGQFSRATDMLYDGMKKGTIESNLNNWKILGAYYQQANRNLDAIKALEEASKLFPKEGSIDLSIAQIYNQEDKTQEAHDHYARAIAKGNLGDKPHQAYVYYAYTSLELGKYDEALKAITEAEKMPDGAKDPQVRTVKEGIEATIAERDAIQGTKKG